MSKIASITCAAVLAASFAMPAMADDYSRVPAGVRSEIKTKCVSRHPGDYSMQSGCIMNQSESWLMVNGYVDQPAQMAEPIITTADGADFRNHAYLRVAAKTCALKIATMISDYNVRGRMMNGHVTDNQIDAYIASYVKQFKAEAGKNRNAFCATARGNLGHFIVDIAQPVAE